MATAVEGEPEPTDPPVADKEKPADPPADEENTETVETPEAEPKKDLEEKPQDNTSKDTNTAANPFERTAGGSFWLLLASAAAALGLGGLAARLRRKAE